VGGNLGTGTEATRRQASGPPSVAPPRGAARALVLALLLAPVPALAQGGLPGERPARGPTLAPDSLVQDTLARDTTLTPRQRALRRLRAMPVSPIQPDHDSLAADSLVADSLVADSLALAPAQGLPPGLVVPDSLMPDTTARGVPPDSLARDPTRLRPIPPDTVGVPIRPGAVLLPSDTLLLAADSAAAAADTAVAGPGRVDPGPVSEQAVRAELQALEGYITTEYDGQGRAVFQADSNRLEITGDSRISREGSQMETDSLLVFAGDRGVVCGYGQPILTGQGEEPVESDQVCFDIDRDVGMARGARTRFTEGATWYVRGPENRVYILTGTENATIYGQRAQFTSCDLEHPHYSFQARSLKMVAGEFMVARDVTLQFEDVPVFWLPWMVQSMKSGRRSGLLMPQFGVNDIVRNDAGYNRHLSNLGFYWAINDYASARGTFEWYSGNWTAVEGALSYAWRRQFLQGALTAKHYWRQREGEPTGRELTLNTSNSWQPDERTRIQMNANYASSTAFVRRNSFDPRELNQSIRSSASVNRSFNWGSMSVGADRQQQLSTDQVSMTLPSLSLSFSPVTLYTSEGGTAITWSGRGSANRQLRDVRPDTTSQSRDSERLTGQASHSLSIGRLGLSQSLNYSQDREGGTAYVQADTLAREPRSTETTMNWSSSVSYQQGLWTGTTLSPSVSVNGNLVRNRATREAMDSLGIAGAGGFVSAPLRVSAGASLNTAIYGFWPGIANFSRIRHKIAPSLSWSYSPAAQTTTLQDAVFGVRDLREQNRITLSFSQTFEGKVRGTEEEADTAVLAEGAEPGEPRRLPQAEKVEILALNTATSFVYDFVAAREDGRGFQTEDISNSIRSDLLPGLQLRMSHDLFEEGVAEPGELAPRTFSPYLTRLSASFSIDNDFWLFRALGLGTSRAEAPDTATAVADTLDQQLTSMGAEANPDRGVGGLGSMVPGGADRRQGGPARQGVGRWRAALDYSLSRSRPSATGASDNQMLRGRISFDPTEHWSVSWNTSYSFTDSEFADHALTLSRDLHRWQANFDFIKAQNGNFIMQFRVQLRDNPDLKLDYDQRDRAVPVAVPVPPVQ
jgi:hypothetical protein